ncbi:nitroreductase family protein [Desulfotomaculum sp. 1211_IL3151]|uniref:nitroreductase family protein n=1 Tax=Desulfotomaculum sp. 1211_IL3151 TaxID=3084055 RepID=UPI002FDA9E78
MLKVNTEACIGCGQCVQDCFPNDIERIDGKAQVKNRNCIKCGHCIAICPKRAISTDEYNMEEVKEYNRDEFSVGAEQLLNFIKFRRSVRQFRDKEVEKEKILQIIEAGRFTQTGSNLQDVSYIVVREGLPELKALTYETLKKMGEHLLDQPTPGAKLLRRYAKMWVDMYQAFQKNPHENDRLFFNAPAIIIVTANSQINGALASSNMELMTNALGLGTFFSGFFVRAAQQSKKIMDFLNIEGDRQVVTCMVIGYPNVKYYRTVPRKEAAIYWK